MNANPQIKVIGKVGQVLELFRERSPELRLQDITQGAGLDTSTATRIVNSLCQIGLLRFDEVQRLYSPGLMVVELSRALIARFSFYELVHRELLSVSSERGWPGYLGMLNEGDHNSVVYLDAVSATPGVIPRTAFGQRLPSHSSASGKLLLALNYVDPSTLDLQRRTSTTHVDVEELRAEFAQIRTQGYSVTEGEEVEGFHGVAAPIMGRDGVVAAIGLETTREAFMTDRPAMVEVAVSKARGISAALNMRSVGKQLTEQIIQGANVPAGARD